MDKEITGFSNWGYEMEASVTWTMVAAIATTLSACVIGWQSWETRKSAGQAKRSADASDKAVGAAIEALELTRQQAKHSQLMAAEAIRSRMEAQGPAIAISFPDTDLDGLPTPAGYAIGTNLSDETFQKVEPGYVFQEMRDDEQWLSAIFRITFTNTASHPVTVFTSAMMGEFRDGQLSVSRRHIRLQSDGTGHGFILVGARVSQWIWVVRQNQREHQVGGSASWCTLLDGDSGVQISQEFKIMGTLLESGSQKGEWRLRGFGPDVNYPSRFVIQPQKREYFVGQDRDGKRHRLPDIDPGTVKD